MQIVTFLLYTTVFCIYLLIAFLIIKSRYRKYSTDTFVLRFRNGLLKSEGYGGGYFILPLIDQLETYPASNQFLEIQQLSLGNNHDTHLSIKILWRIKNPVLFHTKWGNSTISNEPYKERLSHHFTSLIRTEALVYLSSDTNFNYLSFNRALKNTISDQVEDEIVISSLEVEISSRNS